MAYPTIDHPSSEQEARQMLTAIVATGEEAGIRIPEVESGLELISSARRFKQERAERMKGDEQASKRIARSLVSGDIDLDEAVVEAMRVQTLASGSVLSNAINLTEPIAARQAFREIGQSIDGTNLLDRAREVVGETVAAITALRPSLEGIRTADAAATSGAKAGAAWAKYRAELLPRWEAAHKLAKLLRAQHWIDPLPLDCHGGKWARPDLAREDLRAAKRGRAKLLLLLDPVCDRWEPGGPFTEEEARQIADVVEAAEIADVEREDRIARRMGKVVA